jgi:putative intracellular protease/amidase
MHIAILTFEGFNELDSLIALGILNRIKQPGWRVTLSCPTPTVTSMNGVTLHAQSTLADACRADAVLFGSGMQTRALVQDAALMAQLQFDPARQLIGAQCSGTLMLARLGLLGAVPACTDLTTRPWVQEAGVEVLNQPFVARGNVAHCGWLPVLAVPGGLGDRPSGRGWMPRPARSTMSRRWARRMRMSQRPWRTSHPSCRRPADGQHITQPIPCNPKTCKPW